MTATAKRAVKVLKVITDFGFGEFISGSKFEAQLQKLKIKAKKPSDYTKYERFRMALEELGTTYIKLGQILSQRTDLLPEELTRELEKLQDSSTPLDIDMDALIKDEFGKTRKQVFKSFNKEPIGVASIGQVYEGVLLSGERVVLKVRKPGISELVQQDLAFMKDLLGIVKNHPKIRDFRPVDLFESFKDTLLEELDYKRETGNIARFKSNHQDVEHIHVPAIYPELCSSEVICMEFIEGVKIDKLDLVDRMYPDRSELTRKICDYYFDQILEQGFYHADPHPGNIQILSDGKICLIDYGMTGTVLDDDRMDVGIFFLRIINKDVKGIVDFLGEINLNREVRDKDTLNYKIDALIQETNVSIESIDTASLLNKLLALVFDHKIVLPRYFFNLLRTLVLLDGLLRMLSPDLNMLEFIKPYARKLVFQRSNPKTLFRKMLTTASGLERNLTKLPGILNSILVKAADEDLAVGVKVRGMEESITKLEKISNRLILAILVGCLLVASSLVVLANVPPYLWGMPVLGVIGYIISAILAIYIVIKVFRK